MSFQKLKPVHPGEVLMEEFLKLMSISQNELARHINVPPRRINEIVLGKRGITADTALRLACYFGTTAEFWIGLQADYELDVARDRIGAIIARDVKKRTDTAMSGSVTAPAG